MLILSCFAGETVVSIEWVTSVSGDDLPLATLLGLEETESSDWSYGADNRTHSYSGDDEAFVGRLVELEQETLFASSRGLSASFSLAGLSQAVGPLVAACASWSPT